MYRKNKMKAIIAIAVAMVFVMPVAAFANITNDKSIDNDAVDNIQISNNDIIDSDIIESPTERAVLHWKYATGHYVMSSTVVDGRLYSGSYDRNVYCFDADPYDDGIDEGIQDPVGSSYDLIWI